MIQSRAGATCTRFNPRPNPPKTQQGDPLQWLHPASPCSTSFGCHISVTWQRLSLWFCSSSTDRSPGQILSFSLTTRLCLDDRRLIIKPVIRTIWAVGVYLFTKLHPADQSSRSKYIYTYICTCVRTSSEVLLRSSANCAWCMRTRTLIIASYCSKKKIASYALWESGTLHLPYPHTHRSGMILRRRLALLLLNIFLI